MNDLLDAAESNDITMLQTALAGYDVNLADEDGVTPLSAALANGAFDTASGLLEWGADVRAVTVVGSSALHALLHYLCTLPPDWTEAGRAEPVASLHERGHQMAQTLIRRGVRIEQARRPGGQRALHDAMEVSGRIVDTLLGYGAMFEAPDSHGTTAIHLAARHDRWTFLASIRGTMSIDIADHRGVTPLHEAILAGHGQLARTLVHAFRCSPRKCLTADVADIPAGSDAAAIAAIVGNLELAAWLAAPTPHES